MAMAAPSSLPPGFGGISHLRPHEQGPLRIKRPRGKKVSWAAEDQLCQIRMFLAEDAPSVAGATQDHLQVKSTRFMHEAPDLPPGFGAPINVLNVVASIPWKCPHKFEIPSNVEAGGESEELGVQKLRESQVLEAVYPRSSVIPENPFDPLEVPPPVVDDSQVRIIPVTPADEDSDGDDPVLGTSSYQFNNPRMATTATNVPQLASSLGTGLATGLSPSPTMFTALSKEPGVDTSLLIQLLSNPSLVETLSSVRNKSMVNASNNGLNMANAMSSSMMQNLAPNHTISHKITTPLSVLIDHPSSTGGAHPPPQGFSSNVSPPGYGNSSSSLSPPPGFGTSSSPPPGFGANSNSCSGYSSSSAGPPPGFGSFNHKQVLQQQIMPSSTSTSSTSLRPPMRHNEQYFKDLIMQHGGKQQGFENNMSSSNGNNNNNNNNSNSNMNNNGNNNHNNNKRPTRPCAYFNTPKGCRNGSKCMFSHDRCDLKRPLEQTQQQQQQQHGKRMRG